ncbi:ATP-binding protein [Microbacterium indicum]|uniref:ATP-binding protein n=1 Tax=Microbacterium indicum TaxID=358100 RepID=UPI00041B451F|nr:ATP-binding protein [Microbacterium indicum]
MAPDGSSPGTVDAQGGVAAVERAWMLAPRRPERPAEPGFTGARIERAYEILMAIGGVAMGAQTFVVALRHGVLQPGRLPMFAIVMAAVAAVIVCCAIGRGARIAATVFAWLFPASILIWMTGTGTTGVRPPDEPWSFFLISVASSCAIIATRRIAWHLVAAIGIPVLFGIGRVVIGRGEAPYWAQLQYDVSIAILISLGLVLIGVTIRDIAANVDAAREAALAAYSEAIGIESAERERRETAALMHDSVLAALLASARARSPQERRLAVAMAREALNRLADDEQEAAVGTNEPVDAVAIADELRAEIQALGVPIDVVERPGGSAIPGRAARALVLAAAQAVANAVQHAGAEGLGVVVEPAGEGVRITVRDAGHGFDVEAIPADRLGIRGSILARVAAAGGEADVRSDATGTTVTVSYRPPDPRVAATRPVPIVHPGAAA